MTRTFIFPWLKLLDINPEEDEEEDGANIDLDAQRKGKCAVVKTSTRQVKTLNFPQLLKVSEFKNPQN